MDKCKNLLPEEIARQAIDAELADRGWRVVRRKDYVPSRLAQAVCELPSGNQERADYVLFLSGQAIGVIEAKRADIPLLTADHLSQVTFYARHPKQWYPTFSKPLPLTYLANGREIYFRDLRRDDFEHQDARPVNHFPTPKEAQRLLGIADEWAALPPLSEPRLRQCQREAIEHLERSFMEGDRRALIVLATGAGKTIIAIMETYRLLTYTPARHVLFLVDRNNLALQAEQDFGLFRFTESRDPFNSIYEVERLRNRRIPQGAQVVIATIQGLYAYLNRLTVDEDSEEADDSMMHTAGTDPTLPPDFFDCIIIDECHRSIYNNWRRVLEYFDQARLIGLTATPTPEAEEFFGHNVVIRYTYEQSVADGVNVARHIPYRIRTEATEQGGTMAAETRVDEISNYTQLVHEIRLTESRDYSPEELNRSVINPQQIRTILEQYRDAVYRDLFPQRTDTDYRSLPKTLIYALNEPHATLIELIAREVFGKSREQAPHFVQKITYTADDSNQLIRQFRNDKDFRIAITVTLVATGTDIKPLEVVMFMRDVQSRTLYEQMLGRGVRTIQDEALRAVTPNADTKAEFFVVDAVGVTEHGHTLTLSPSQPQPPQLTLRELLERITFGDVGDTNLSLLGNRLTRINNRTPREKQRQRFTQLAGQSMHDLSLRLLTRLHQQDLPPFLGINEANTERRALVSPLTEHPAAREYLLELNAGITTVMKPGQDSLIYAGFSLDDARATTQSFEDYITRHRDESEALRVIYRNQGEPLTRPMLDDLRQRLLHADQRFAQATLWDCYALLRPDVVTRPESTEERDTLTGLISLVRFAWHLTERLTPLARRANSLFNLWQGKHHDELSLMQVDLFRRVLSFIVSNGWADYAALLDLDRDTAAMLVGSFAAGSAPRQKPYERADAYIQSLSRFIIYNNSYAA